MQPGLDKEAGVCTVSAEIAKRVFYNDMSEAEGEKWSKELRPWNIGCTFSLSSYAGWRVIPSTYMFCKRDETVFGQWARMLVDAASQERDGLGFMVDIEEEVDAGHAVMLSQPDWTVDILVRAAKAPAA